MVGQKYLMETLINGYWIGTLRENVYSLKEKSKTPFPNTIKEQGGGGGGDKI